jgi:hypothetical protein
MARWLPDQRIVVTAAPGTGSTSLIHALDRISGSRVVPSADVVIDGTTVVDQKHGTVAELVAAELFDPPEGTRIVTTVRNPFDFCVVSPKRFALPATATDLPTRPPGSGSTRIG